MKHHSQSNLRGAALAVVVLSGSLWAHTAVALDTPAAQPLKVAHATTLAAPNKRTPAIADLSQVTREFRVEVRENLRVQLAAEIDRNLNEAKVVAD